MPKVDLTVTISVIIAICAIISPIITTLLNNHHICKMRKLDDAAQLQKDSYFYKRGIYEDYLRCTCRCITAASPAALNDYGKAYALALIALNNDIKHYLWGEASSKLNELAPLIREQLQKM